MVPRTVVRTRLKSLPTSFAMPKSAPLVLVEQDVLRLDVAVDDAVPATLVEVQQAPGGAEGDLEPCAPAQCRRRRSSPQKRPVQRIVLDFGVSKNIGGAR
jgi:hypothetical protein